MQQQIDKTPCEQVSEEGEDGGGALDLILSWRQTPVDSVVQQAHVPRNREKLSVLSTATCCCLSLGKFHKGQIKMTSVMKII